MSAAVMTLYDIEDTLAAFANTVDLVSDEERAEFERQLDALLAQGAKKYDSVARFLAHLDSQIELATAEQKRLRLRAMRFETAKAELQRYVLACMKLRDVRSLEGEAFTLRAVKNNDSVAILDAELIPLQLKRHVPAVAESWTPDKTAIAKAIKDGFDVPGADLLRGDDRLEVK